MKGPVVLVGVALAALVGVAVLRVERSRRAWNVRLSDAIPVHSKWWRQRAKQPGEMLYVALGDSAAQGIGASRPDLGYVGLVAAEIERRTGRPVRVMNLGVAGADLAACVRDQLPRLAALCPDLCTVAIGANDVLGFEPARFARDLDIVLDALPPGSIVADVPSFSILPADRSARAASAIVQRAVAERGLVLAPLSAATRRGGPFSTVAASAGDFFHPNDRGYARWASAFLPAIGEALTSRERGGGSGSPAAPA